MASNLPSFQMVKDGCTSQVDLCVRVTFADGTTDHVEAKEYHPERHIRHNDFKGQLASTQSAEAVVILAKADGQKDLVVFKSVHSPDCSVFSVDLEVRQI